MGQLCSCTRSQTASEKLPLRTTLLPPDQQALLQSALDKRGEKTRNLLIRPTLSNCDENWSKRHLLPGVFEGYGGTEGPETEEEVITARTAVPLTQSHSIVDDVTDGDYARSISASVVDIEGNASVSASSSAASSSLVTSLGSRILSTGDKQDLFDINDDIELEFDSQSVTLRRDDQFSGCDQEILRSRAKAKLGELLRRVVELLIAAEIDIGGDFNQGNHIMFVLDRMLRHVYDAHDVSFETWRYQSAPTVTSATVSERLDDVINDQGLDLAITVVANALHQAFNDRSDFDAGNRQMERRLIELLYSIQFLYQLTSCDELPQEQHPVDSHCFRVAADYNSSSMTGSEIDVQLILCDNDLLEDGTLTRRVSSRRALQRAAGRRYFLRQTAAGNRASAISISTFDQSTIPSLSVRLVNWCICSESRSQCLSKLLSETNSVIDLSIVRSDIEGGLSDAAAAAGEAWLVDALRSNAGLIRLNLRLSPLGGPGAIARLGDAVAKHLRLRRLNVAGTGMTDEGLSALMAEVSKSRRLAELDIGFNDFSHDTGCASVAVALARCAPPLRRLRMRDVGLSSAAAAVLMTSVSRNARLRLLDLSGNHVGDVAVRYLAEAMIVNRTLRELWIENCGIGPVGCASLARGLRANCSLRSLQLSRNAIGQHGMALIADGLKYNRTLTSLGANQCQVGNAGLKSLLTALGHNTTVNNVKLCYNEIGISRSSSSSVPQQRRQLQRNQLPSSLSSFDSAVSACSLPKATGSSSLSSVASAGGAIMATSGVGQPENDDDAFEAVARSPSVNAVVVGSVTEDVGVDCDNNDDDVDATLSELYSRLRQVLHSNAKLKILLWGNRMDGWSTTAA